MREPRMTRNGSGLFPTPFSRFEGYTYPEPNTGCWIWTGTMNRDGYGIINSGKRPWLAHRFSYWCLIGMFDKSMVICHNCDNPWCVNPNHLFIGTQSDNMKDALRKRRVSHGINHVKAKLDEIQVITIRTAFNSGVTRYQLANYFKVSYSAIQGILNKLNWKHL